MKAMKALIWNEWHLQRKPFFICVGISVVVWLLVSVMLRLSVSRDVIETTAFILSFTLPFLFCCTISDSFSGEYVRKTDSFLLGLPIGTTRIYICKYLFNLLLFIFLMVFLVVLMFKFLFLTGKSFLVGLDFQETVSFGLTFLFIYVLTHATMFFSTLVGRNSSSWAMTIILLPVTYVLLLPGTFTVSALFPSQVANWIIVSLVLTVIVLYCFWLGFGWYLWTRRISRGLKILKPVLISVVAVIITQLFLYLTVYIYSAYDLSTAKREAKENGIILDFNKLIPPPVSADSNMAPEIMEFDREYIKFCDNDKNKKTVAFFSSNCTSKSWTKTSFSFYSIPKKLPFKTERRIADFILDNPEICKLNQILTKAFAKPECRFDVDYEAKNPSMILIPHLSVTRHVVDFLSDRAYALRLRGQNRDFFSCLNKIDKLCATLAKEPFIISKSVEIEARKMKCRTVIATGPNTPDSIPNYHQLIRETKTIHFNSPDEMYYTLKMLEYLESPEFSIEMMNISHNKFSIIWRAWFLYIPRMRFNTAHWLRWNIKKKKLFEKIEKGKSLPEIEKEYDGSGDWNNWETRGFSGFLNYYTPVLRYFRDRSWLDLYRIALALKIYRIQHGVFPATLTPLSPGILPEIPIDPISGKDLEYKLKGNGFLLHGKRERKFYQAYILYHPWNPTKEEEE